MLEIGGTGLISTGIIRQLVASGHDVTCLTRGETSANLPDAVKFITGDRNDDSVLAEAAQAQRFECVIDMVCFTPAQKRATIDAFAGNVEQYVFCSTVDVYHRPVRRNPVTQGAPRTVDLDLPPVSKYGSDKGAAENALFRADERRDSVEGFNVTIIRPWSTYGEGGSVLPTFGSSTYYLDRIRTGKPIIVHGDGSSLWGPCHRDDVAAAFVGAVGNESAYGNAYHVTSEEVMAWDQYHRIVADVLDAPEPEFVHIPTELSSEGRTRPYGYARCPLSIQHGFRQRQRSP